MIDYYLLTKPGIIMGNLVTFAAAFWLGSKGNIDAWLFIQTLLGLAFIMASGCVFNNYIDRNIDTKMKRTKNRPLVNGRISERNAILFGTLLLILGNIAFPNILTLFIADLGFFIYVIPYSLWKSRTVHGTIIGSIAGAIPPVVGYCAVTNNFDMGAFILFLMLVLWQMPHFFSIALMHLEDYLAAGIPVLPAVKGITETKIQMMLYICAFIVASSMLTFYQYTGILYLVVAITFGLLWLALCIVGFKRLDNQLWGKRMFQMSLAMIGAICLTIPFDIIL